MPYDNQRRLIASQRAVTSNLPGSNFPRLSRQLAQISQIQVHGLRDRRSLRTGLKLLPQSDAGRGTPV